MDNGTARLRQIMDWRAAIMVAGLLAGAPTMLLWVILLAPDNRRQRVAPFHHVAAIPLGQRF